MKNREELPINKKENKEKENRNPLVAFKEKETKAMEEDKLHPRAWEHIDPDKLIDECQEVFDLYKNGGIDSLNSASDMIVVIKEKIEGIKDKKTKDINDIFVKWIDNMVQEARSTAFTKDELAK